MAFALNEDQALLKESADGFFADKAPVSAFRALRDAGKVFDAGVWSGIGELGFAGALIDEAHGGVGMGHRAAALVLEAQAKGLGVSPLFQTGWIAAGAINLLGTGLQKAHWLPKIAAGETRFAFALEEGPHHKAAGYAATIDKAGQVTAHKRFVPDGGGADVLLVAVTTPSGAPGIAIVESGAEGVARQPRHGLDSRDLADLAVSGAKGELLGEGKSGADDFGAVLDLARIGSAVEMLGLMSACFEMTNDYLKTRTQFGQLIGSFQSLQHRAAAMLVEMELTRSCVVAAVDALDRHAAGDLSASKLADAASLAKARAGDTLHLVTNETVQMHGGIGQTDAHDSGLYLKRARVLEAQYGSAAFHRDRWAALNGF